jgi:hypothetical protein
MIFSISGYKRRISGSLFAGVLAVAAMSGAQAAGVSGQGTWQTTLQARDLDGNLGNGPEAFFDAVLNVTWLADANYAKTSGYDADGYMTWRDALDWAAQLNINGIAGWRLPSMLDTATVGCNFADAGTDCGYNSDTSISELTHMYYLTLGNKSVVGTAGNFQPDFGLKNSGPFSNVESDGLWSKVTVAPDVSVNPALEYPYVGYFYSYNGLQNFASKFSPQFESVEFTAWAVRPGDVAAVPEPQTYALALAGLAAAVFAGKRRQR